MKKHIAITKHTTTEAKPLSMEERYIGQATFLLNDRINNSPPTNDRDIEALQSLVNTWLKEKDGRTLTTFVRSNDKVAPELNYWIQYCVLKSGTLGDHDIHRERQSILGLAATSINDTEDSNHTVSLRKAALVAILYGYNTVPEESVSVHRDQLLRSSLPSSIKVQALTGLYPDTFNSNTIKNAEQNAIRNTNALDIEEKVSILTLKLS